MADRQEDIVLTSRISAVIAVASLIALCVLIACPHMTGDVESEGSVPEETSAHIAANANFAYPVGPAGGALGGTYPNPSVPWTADASGAQMGAVSVTDAGTLQALPCYASQVGQFFTCAAGGYNLAGPHVTSFSGAGTYTYTPTFTGWVLVQGCGGGGGGAGGGAYQKCGGGGGGGALWGGKWVQVTASTGYTITIAASASGGTGSASGAGTAGQPGGDATFSTLVSFAGASGGGGCNGTNTGFGAGGQATQTVGVNDASPPTNNLYTSVSNNAATANVTSLFQCPSCGGWSGNAGTLALSGSNAPVRMSASAPGYGAGLYGGGGGGEGGNGSGGNGGFTPVADGGTTGNGAAAGSCGGGGGGSTSGGSGGTGGGGGTGGTGFVVVFD